MSNDKWRMVLSVCVFAVIVSKLTEELVEQSHRQADDIEIVAPDPFDKPRCATLNRVGAGLAHGFAGCHIPGDFVVGHRREADLR